MLLTKRLAKQTTMLLEGMTVYETRYCTFSAKGNNFTTCYWYSLWFSINDDVFFLTQTQLSSDNDWDEIKNLPDKCITCFSINDHCFSCLATCYQNSAYIQHYEKGVAISNITFYKSKYSSDNITVALIYRWHLSNVLTFY